jgi:glycosyltransferase involved in cell wall biosynthesis
MNIAGQYNLVHITSDGEYMAALVASQLFDQAECQAVNKSGFAPASVQAWVIGGMGEYFSDKAKQKIASLRTRCPHVGIKMISGIGRLKNFPIMQLLKYNRSKLGTKIPVIYHCRGESAAQWAIKLRRSFPNDKVVLDVRGYWPAEMLYARGIDDITLATGKDEADFKAAFSFLKTTINKVDAVTTVSTALRDLLIQETGAPANTAVVPCCVNHITDDSKRDKLRASWGIKDNEVVLVYSGTTAKYQHLDDLTIPFLKQLLATNSNLRLAFFSGEQEKIKKMLADAGINHPGTIIKSFAQNEVADALTACDLGILIRKPTLVNRVANPVKIAEYMAAGLPIIIEKGVGGVANILFDRSLLKGIEIAGLGANMAASAADVNNWITGGVKNKREHVRNYVREVYLWSSAIHVTRRMYEEALNK